MSPEQSVHDGGGRQWSRILVRLPNWVGDVVMATPALRALRQRYPDAHLAATMREYLVPLLEGTKLLDEVIPIGSTDEGGIGGTLRLARKLRSRRFDAVFLLTNSLGTALPLFFSRIPHRIGYTGDLRRPLLTRWGRPPREGRKRKPIPMTDYYQGVLDLGDVPRSGTATELPMLTEDLEAARAGLMGLGWDGESRLAGFNPGASFGSSKLWVESRLAKVARQLRDRHDLVPVVLCGPKEKELAGSLAAQIGERVLDTSRAVVDLRALRGLMRHLEILVTTDTGPRHVAVAMGRPVVVIMGPTYPQWTASNLERTRVIRCDVPCGPCHLKTCPLEDQICMTRISVEEVLGAAEALLADQ